MRIALILENSQKKKVEYVKSVLERVAQKYNHEIFCYGVSENSKVSIDYVGAGVLTGILLNTGAVDFVITGCSTGCGASIASNMMPNVYCGYVKDKVDALLFRKINAGNAVSIPYGRIFGVGFEIVLEEIFTTLFETEEASGYPSERKEIQDKQRDNLVKIKKCTNRDLLSILEEMDKDYLYSIVHNDYFEENFFKYSENDEIALFLKNIIDAFE